MSLRSDNSFRLQDIRHGNIGGFTLIELLTTVALLVVLGTVALPSFSGFIADRRVQSAAVDLMAGLNYARTEAIKRNDEIFVVVGDSSDWGAGWAVVTVEAQTYAGCLTAATNPNCLKVQPAQAHIVISSGPAQVTYVKSGRLDTPGDIDFILCDSKSSANVTKRRLTVGPSGRSNITRLSERCDV